MVMQPSERITRLLIIFIVGVFIIKSITGSGFFESKNYKAKGYAVMIPDGWERVKEKKGNKTTYPQGVSVVMFIPKGVDLEKEKPEANITIFTKKLAAPIWIEDEFPEIIGSLVKEGFKVMDKGEIKLDDVVSAWVVYHDVKVPELVLEFYMVTDNSVFYKIQYSSHPNLFNVHRRALESLKESFKFRFSLY